MFTSSTPKIIYFYKNLIKDEKFICFPVCMLCTGSFCPKCHMALWRKWRKLCATYANVPSGTNIEKPVFMVLLVLKCHMALWHKWHKLHI
nr:MAG TPA: hypothetical protein [Microviridae sp.]